jgi:hypothetical protein
VSFYALDICFRDAQKFVPIIAASRHLDPTAGLLVLDQLVLPVKQYAEKSIKVPKGRLRVAQDVSPGCVREYDLVPKGRLKITQGLLN